MKTTAELKKVAKDMAQGLIFSDRNCKGQKEVRMVFFCLLLADAKQLAAWRRAKVNFIYEYLTEAGPRSVNGFPHFTTMRMLRAPETKEMFRLYRKIKKIYAEADRQIEGLK